MKTTKYISAIIIAVLFSACGTTKKAVQPPVVTPPVAAVSSTAEMIKTLQENQPAFKTANASKMSIDVDFKGRQMNVGGVCQMVTDSAIHLSIMPFMGIELFKLELTPQGFVLIDKMNKRFYENTYAYFKNHFGVPVTFDAIQSLISNRLFFAEKKAYLNSDFTWKDNQPTTLTMLSKGEKTEQETKIDASLLNRISQILIKAAEYNAVLYADYTGFQQTDDFLFPRKITFQAEQNGEKKASFNFDIQKMKFNEPLTLKPTNLSRYTRGDLNDLFKK